MPARGKQQRRASKSRGLALLARSCVRPSAGRRLQRQSLAGVAGVAGVVVLVVVLKLQMLMLSVGLRGWIKGGGGLGRRGKEACGCCCQVGRCGLAGRG